MRAAAYARYSTDKQTNSSIAYQMNRIEAYCKSNNIDIVARFKDEACSGTNTDRPAFQELGRQAKLKLFDCVIVYDISRGSRDVGDWFAFRKAMAILGIDVISVEDKLGNLLDPSDYLMELITVGLGQHQVLQTRQKSMDSIAVKAKYGQFLGGIAPLGYDIEGGKYIINPHEADIVKKIFAWYASGKSYNYIIGQLKGEIGKRGRPIGKNSLYSILTNERYIGVYTWNKRKVKVMGKWAGGMPNPNCTRIEDAILPIINNDTWEKVRKRMESNKKASNKAKNEYLLSGLIECGACKAAYVGHCSTNKKGYKTRYYCCGNKYRTHECTNKNINADELEEFVIQHLKMYLLSINFEDIATIIADMVNSASKDLSAEKKELASIQIKINNGMKAILNGLEFPELQAEINRMRIRKSELDDIITRNEKSTTKLDKSKLVALFNESLANWDMDIKTILQTHITKIYANTDGTITVNVGVHINGCGGTQPIICTIFVLPCMYKINGD